MVTPLHVRTRARVDSPAVKPAQLGDQHEDGELVIGDLIVTAGPKNDTGRLVRVFLTRKQAQGLAAQLDAMLAE